MAKTRLITRGDVLKRRRQALYMTAEEVAKRANVTPATVYAWEKGTQNITVANARAIAAALECHPREVTQYVEQEVSA